MTVLFHYFWSTYISLSSSRTLHNKLFSSSLSLVSLLILNCSQFVDCSNHFYQLDSIKIHSYTTRQHFPRTFSTIFQHTNERAFPDFHRAKENSFVGIPRSRLSANSLSEVLRRSKRIESASECFSEGFLRILELNLYVNHQPPIGRNLHYALQLFTQCSAT